MDPVAPEAIGEICGRKTPGTPVFITTIVPAGGGEATAIISIKRDVNPTHYVTRNGKITAKLALD